MSEDDRPDRLEAYWKMYLEHCTQGRHHETQRSAVATALIGIAVVAVGIATTDTPLTRNDLPMTLLVVAIGLFGVIFSAKHYERFRLHMERAAGYRNAIDQLLSGQPLGKIKRDADAANAKKHPCLNKLRLNGFWSLLYGFVVLIGVTLSVFAVIQHPPI